MGYCVYLRKSRADMENERAGRLETLARHKSILLGYAAENGLAVTKIYEEIASGESIAGRPEMLSLLEGVNAGKYDGVLVMDIDRLGRGNMREQGTILEAFKESGTRIITPSKVYDLENEFDEEYSEFAAFFARKELKLINRRLQRGRLKSAEEGNYIGAVPPYGYSIVKRGKRRTLAPAPEQAEIVRLIFGVYAEGNRGAKKIAALLNEMGVKSYTGRQWSGSAVLSVLKNGVYAGRIEWKKGTENEIAVENAHEPLVEPALFERARARLGGCYHSPYNTKMSNPLSGLVFCKRCGASMVLRPYGEKAPHIVCYRHCGTKSSKLAFIEEKILCSIDELDECHENLVNGLSFAFAADEPSRFQNLSKTLKNELDGALRQKERLCELLEREIYDAATFMARNERLASEIKRLNAGIRLAESHAEAAKRDITPLRQSFGGLTDIYHILDTPERKNRFLKSVISRVEYSKAKGQRLDDFRLKIYTRI